MTPSQIVNRINIILLHKTEIFESTSTELNYDSAMLLITHVLPPIPTRGKYLQRRFHSVDVQEFICS